MFYFDLLLTTFNAFIKILTIYVRKKIASLPKRVNISLRFCNFDVKRSLFSFLLLMSEYLRLFFPLWSYRVGAHNFCSPTRYVLT